MSIKLAAVRAEEWMLKHVQHDGRIWFAGLVTLLAGCATTPRQAVQPVPQGPVEVQILAINDFHGNLEPPNLTIPAADGAVPAGGVAYLASAMKQLRTANSVTV